MEMLVTLSIVYSLNTPCMNTLNTTVYYPTVIITKLYTVGYITTYLAMSIYSTNASLLIYKSYLVRVIKHRSQVLS